MKKLIKKLFLLLLTGLIILTGIYIYSGYTKYRSALNEKPVEDMIAEICEKESFSYYAEIPQTYFHALIAVEDRRFYTHNGFDIIGTSRAIYNDFKAGKYMEGGSTLSQQLAKNLYFPMDNTLERKIAEIFMALKLEKTLGKEGILEIYANVVYFGSGYYSIGEAAKGYFDKNVNELNAAECTLLAGIPNAPSVYSLDVNPELAYQRQKKVIECMIECGYITEEQAEDIRNMKAAH